MIREQILETLSRFRPISLKETGSIKLMDRTDVKYQCRLNQLPHILEKALPDFRVLENKESRLPQYKTVYLDTKDHRMYLDHHNGKLNRYKIRIRNYINSNEFFLEIKTKNNHEKTEKKRIPITPERDFHQDEYSRFIFEHSPFDPETLEPVLSTSFNRMTLVHLQNHERVTIDVFPSWSDGRRMAKLSNLVIIEVKSAHAATSTGFGYLLREERVQPYRISKYCTGMVLLYPELKHNRFKAKLLHLNKLDNTLTYHDTAIALI
jgi:hypothetical protein